MRGTYTKYVRSPEQRKINDEKRIRARSLVGKQIDVCGAIGWGRKVDESTGELIVDFGTKSVACNPLVCKEYLTQGSAPTPLKRTR